MQFGCLSSHWKLFVCTVFTPVYNFKAIGQLVMEILHFEDLGDTENVVTNTVVLVSGKCHIQWQRTSGGYRPSCKVVLQYIGNWQCYATLKSSRTDRHTYTQTDRQTDRHPQYNCFATAQLINNDWRVRHYQHLYMSKTFVSNKYSWWQMSEKLVAHQTFVPRHKFISNFPTIRLLDEWDYTNKNSLAGISWEWLLSHYTCICAIHTYTIWPWCKYLIPVRCPEATMVIEYATLHGCHVNTPHSVYKNLAISYMLPRHSRTFIWELC